MLYKHFDNYLYLITNKTICYIFYGVVQNPGTQQYFLKYKVTNGNLISSTGSSKASADVMPRCPPNESRALLLASESSAPFLSSSAVVELSLWTWWTCESPLSSTNTRALFPSARGGSFDLRLRLCFNGDCSTERLEAEVSMWGSSSLAFTESCRWRTGG